jgi:hypothetical protein
MTFLALLLICSVSIPPDQCTPDNAEDSISKVVFSELQCPVLADAQVQFASDAYRDLRDGKALIVTRCLRRKS